MKSYAYIVLFAALLSGCAVVETVPGDSSSRKVVLTEEGKDIAAGAAIGAGLNGKKGALIGGGIGYFFGRDALRNMRLSHPGYGYRGYAPPEYGRTRCRSTVRRVENSDGSYTVYPSEERCRSSVVRPGYQNW